MAGTLYVVATPLGNLSDLSPRAAATLRAVDTVAAEDTRRTLGLLHSIEAHPHLMSYHAHSSSGRHRELLDILQQGRDVALVTDAGTPAISDPGVDIVAAARDAGIGVVPIPGPSAVATALSVAGLSGDRYLFLGFLPRKGAMRRRLLERVAGEPWSVVVFEAANRVLELLDDLANVCGGSRVAVVARELTKLHEDVRRGTLDELQAYYRDHEPIGEVTVVIAGNPIDGASGDTADPVDVVAAIREQLDAGASRKDVVQMVCVRFGLSRNDAYRRVTEQS